MKRLPFIGSRLRLKVVALILLFTTAATSPWILEWALHGYVERTASALNGAEVSIGTFRLSFLSGTGTLRNIQITQHTEPRFNLFEIEEIQFSFNRNALVSGRIQIPQMQVFGAQLRTPRERSGGLPSDLLPSPTPLVDRVRPDAAFLPPGTVKASPLRFISALSQNREAAVIDEAVRRTSALQREITAFAEQVQTHSSAWAQSLASLVAPEKNPGPYLIQRRLEQLQELKDRVKKETNLLRATKDSIQANLRTRAEETLNRQGIQSGDSADLSEAIFGSRFAGYVERLSYWVEASRRRIDFGPALGSLAKDPKDPFIAIEEISFLPSPSGQKNALLGKIQHFSTFPVGKTSPLVAALKAEWGNGSSADLDLRVDHTGANPVETLLLRAKELELNQWQIESSADFKFAVSSQNAGFLFETKSSETGVDAKGTLEVENPAFLVSARSQVFEKTLLKALPAKPERLSVAASLQNQALKIQSSLGMPLAQELRAEFGPAMKARYELAALELATKSEKALLQSEQALEAQSLKTITQSEQGIAHWSSLQKTR